MLLHGQNTFVFAGGIPLFPRQLSFTIDLDGSVTDQAPALRSATSQTPPPLAELFILQVTGVDSGYFCGSTFFSWNSIATLTLSLSNFSLLILIIATFFLGFKSFRK